MYSPLQLSLKYIRYRLRAFNGRGHGMHSPFVYNFIRSVLNDKKRYPEYDRVESVRAALKKDQTLLTVKDLGAGSVHGTAPSRSVASIATHAAKPAKYGQLLFRMARHYQPSSILELGTSLGITTRYLALGNPDALVKTIEGVPSIAAFARGSFEKEGISVQFKEGNFDDTLMPVLQETGNIDLCFVDGNHRLEPTVRYFEQILPYTHNASIIIFDDIHWSREMEQAWDHIRGHEAVRCSVDLFFIGIVFFRKEFREKQHFSILF